MKNTINRMFFKDCAAVILSTAFMWVILILVMISVGDIAPEQAVRLVIFFVGLGVGAFATASSMAVIIHLIKNKDELYGEELSCSENTHEKHQGS